MKIKIDDFPDVRERLDVRGVPTVIFFGDGVELARLVGTMPKPALLAAFDAFL